MGAGMCSSFLRCLVGEFKSYAPKLVGAHCSTQSTVSTFTSSPTDVEAPSGPYYKWSI